MKDNTMPTTAVEAQPAMVGLVHPSLGKVAVLLDSRCEVCRYIPASPPEDVVDAELYHSPPADSLGRDFLPAAHNRMLHAEGPVGAALGVLAAANRAAQSMAAGDVS